MSQAVRFRWVLIYCVVLSGTLSAQEPPPAVIAGPVGAQTPPCKWGAYAWDAVNSEWVWFGGCGGLSANGALLTWVWKDGVWTEIQFGDAEARARVALCRTLVRSVRNLYAAVANRVYQSESDAERAVDLQALADGIHSNWNALVEQISGTVARAAATNAGARIAALASRLGGGLTVQEVADARTAWQDCVATEWALDLQPQPRGYHAMAADPVSKKIILFGGEGEHGAYNDTWLYDGTTRSWTRVEPPKAPPPRLGHGMIGFGGKVYLVGGQEPRGSMAYTAALWQRLPMDVWEFEIGARTWKIIRKGTEEVSPRPTQPPVQVTITPDGTNLSWKADIVSYGSVVGTITGSMPLPGSDVGTELYGVAPNLVKVRGVGFDPAWYENAPPDPVGFAARLAALPPNVWSNVSPPRLHVQRDWGTTVLDVWRDQLLHWAGGHSSHCGTDVAHFSLTAGRWHILYTPEMPFEWCYSNDGALVPSFTGRPWASHSYLSYACDERTGRMMWTGIHSAYRLTNPCGVFVYDPATYEWSRAQWEIRGGWFHAERHKTCTARTPHGIATWADKATGTGSKSGLWMADLSRCVFEPVAATDPNDRTTFPIPVTGDRHGMTYDSRRGRTLMFHFGLTEKFKVWACDLGTGNAQVLTPRGFENFPMDVIMGREATYLPDDDLVIICTPGSPQQRTLIYDCHGNRWLLMPSAFRITPQGKPDPGYGVSTGIEWDPKRKLIWLVQTDGSVYVMRFERGTAGLQPLTDEGTVFLLSSYRYLPWKLAVR